MEVQYLVGLCCLHRFPDAVRIVLGDFVTDDASGSERDVDVTVEFPQENGEAGAFMGIEVKRHRRPLDIQHIDELVGKLSSMTRVTRRAIVSGSGFTEPAIRKAGAFGIDLFVLEQWTAPVATEFPGQTLTGAPDDAILFTSNSVEFQDQVCIVPNPHIPDGQREGLPIGPDSPVLTVHGNAHPEFVIFGRLVDQLIQFLANQLRSSEAAMAAFYAPSPVPPHERPDGPIGDPVAVDTVFELPSGIYLAGRSRPVALTHIQVSGCARFVRRRIRGSDSYIMRNLTTGRAFAGARIAQMPGQPGLLMAATMREGTTSMAITHLQLTPAQQKQIRRLMLRGSASGSTKS